MVGIALEVGQSDSCIVGSTLIEGDDVGKVECTMDGAPDGFADLILVGVDDGETVGWEDGFKLGLWEGEVVGGVVR